MDLRYCRSAMGVGARHPERVVRVSRRRCHFGDPTLTSPMYVGFITPTQGVA